MQILHSKLLAKACLFQCLGLFQYTQTRLHFTTVWSVTFLPIYRIEGWGWLGEAKVSCILHHRCVHLILAYSWARPAALIAGKGRGRMFLFLQFLHFHSFSSFSPVPPFHLLYYLFSLSSPFLSEMTQKWPTRVDVLLNLNTNQIPNWGNPLKNTIDCIDRDGTN